MVSLSEAGSRVWQQVDYEFDPGREAFPGESYKSERIYGMVRGEEIDIRVLHANENGHLVSGRVGAMKASLNPDAAYEIFNRYAPMLREKHGVVLDSTSEK